MVEKINIGDYGEISFILRKKREFPFDGELFIDTGFVFYGTVMDADRNNLLIIDNDEMEFIVPKKQIRSFELKEVKI